MSRTLLLCSLLAYPEFKFQTRYCHRAPSVCPSPILTSPAKPLGRSGWNLAATFLSWLVTGIVKFVLVTWLEVGKNGRLSRFLQKNFFPDPPVRMLQNLGYNIRIGSWCQIAEFMPITWPEVCENGRLRQLLRKSHSFLSKSSSPYPPVRMLRNLGYNIRTESWHASYQVKI